MEINEILQGTENALYVVRRDDLIDYATACANKILANQHKPANKQEPEQPISQPEAIKFLGKSRQTLSKWRKNGVIEAHTLGGRVYYLRSELLAALQRKSA